ncbi:MAG: alpha/beta family hydrolase [Desertimonas sp.]
MTRRRGTLLLFPGAGASRDQATLVALDEASAPAWSTVRADFPYRRAGRRAPDRAPVLMAAVRDELAAIRSRRVVAGGRSMGGRIASMVAAGADGAAPPATVKGLVLISYPLHPPGKPDRLRTEHLADLRVPCLFVHGTKDPFGTPAELERWTATIPGPVSHHWVDGRGHDLKGRDAEVVETVVGWLATVP